MRRVLIIGPAHPLRGGLATFNHRLAYAFKENGMDAELVSFSLQYPSVLFPGKTQYSDEPAPTGLRIRSLINSINPLNWYLVGRRLRKERFDLIIVRYWLPFMGPALGTILREIKKNRHSRVVCIADNVIPHEARPGDRLFTRYFVSACQAFLTMSVKVKSDLTQFIAHQPTVLASHPLYDNFGGPIDKSEARKILGLDPDQKIILFFGFIRPYKGLDLLLEAMADRRIRTSGIKLMVAGEFYTDRKPYDELIKALGIHEQLVLKTDFIPDSQVRQFLCAADFVIQPYKSATQSGVTPLAYHFEKPMLVTNVGGLPDLVPHGDSGLVVEPNAESIAAGILELYRLGDKHFLSHIRRIKKELSWDVLTQKLIDLAYGISK